MNKNTIKILKRLIILVFKVDTKPGFRPMITFIFNLKASMGIVHAIKYGKQMRLHCTRYMCGNPLLYNNMSIGLTKDGGPKRLLFLKPFADSGSLRDKKLLLTILNFSRSGKLTGKEGDKVDPKLNNITDSYKGSKYTIPGGFINKFVQDFHLIESSPSFARDNIFLSNKAGPHGPATLTALNSIINYDYYQMQNIFNITDQEGIDFFSKSYKFAFDNDIKPLNNKGNKFPYLGKISFVQDPEAKLRVIAISDYYTQLFMRPIHDKLMNKLHNFVCDRTFTQDPMHTGNLENSEDFGSLDLSAATDRFPLTLQKRLLTRIFNQKISESGAGLLSQREFLLEDDHTIKYSVGQPMGTYSSGVAFTLTHHLVVHGCAHLCGLHNFNQYIILGDDIVIKNNKVAEMYKKVITKLGVEISEQKTHRSKDTYEFAKRWIVPSTKDEITGLPLNGIISNFKNPKIVTTILYDFFVIKGNQRFSNLTLGNLIVALYHNFRGKEMTKKKGKLSLKVMNLQLNRNKINMVRTFILCLDMTFNYSYDKLRALLASRITNDSYVIPGERVALLEFKRILLFGMVKYAMDVNYRMITAPDKLISKFDREDLNELVNYPIFVSIVNTLNRMKQTVNSFNTGQISELHEVAKNFSDLNLDSLFNKERNKINSLMIMNKILLEGIRHINSMDEVFYGSSGATDSYNTTEFFELMKDSFTNQTILRIMDGEWKKPVENLYTEDAGAAFFKT